MKNCLVKESKYNVLILNLPVNMDKDTIVEIADRILKNKVNVDYMMSECECIIDPDITKNKDDKNYHIDNLDNIDFQVRYFDIRTNESFDYIFNKAM